MKEKNIFGYRVLAVIFVIGITVFLAGRTLFAGSTAMLPTERIDDGSGYMPPAALGASQGAVEGMVGLNQDVEDGEVGGEAAEPPMAAEGAAPPTYEYDGLGRIVKTTFDTGDFIITEYWGDTTNKLKDSFYGAGWVWQKAIEYYTDGTTMHYQWIADANPGTDGDVIRYEYDSMGRATYTYFDTGDFISTYYWGTTNNKQHDVFFTPDWIWTKSIGYYADGVTVQHLWVEDPDPGVDGDVYHFEYDMAGKVINEQLDNGDWIFIDYWASGDTKLVTYIANDWTWLNATEYYDSTGIIHFKWQADMYIRIGDIVYLENDLSGRVIERHLDDGTMIMTDYWSNGNRKIEEYYAADWTWKQSIKYKEGDGFKIQYHWLADAHPFVDGDVIYQEYDLGGRLIDKLLDDGSFTRTFYWSDDFRDPRYQEHFYFAGWAWYNTKEYWENGVILHYQWLADANPTIVGDVIYEEYDAAGVVIFKQFDDGTTWHI